MKNYNYADAVKEDVLDYIRENYTNKELLEKLKDSDVFAEKLNDDLWTEDAVTGNGSGSYTFNGTKAKEYVMSDYETVRDALTEFCVEAEKITEWFLCEDWESLDVTARCYVLGSAVWEAVEELKEKETR